MSDSASSSVPGRVEEAIEALAKRLHWKMEILEPTTDSEWERLGERQRDFYRHSVRAIFQERELARIALG
jgi:hypothetical protein